MRDAWRNKDYSEVLGLIRNPGLQRDLSGELVVRESRPGEYGELLPPHDVVHAVDCGNSSLHEVLRIGARRGIERGAMDIDSSVSHRWRESIPRPAGHIENTAEHLPRDRGMRSAAESLPSKAGRRP